MKQFVAEVLNEPKKRIIACSFVIFYPFLSLLVGAPIPFPSLFDVKPEQLAIFNFMSLLVTVLGSITGIGFYLERRQNLKVEIVRQDIKELRNEVKQLEERLCKTITYKNIDIEKTIEAKVNSAKDLVDTKFRHMEQVASGMQKAIDFIQQFQFGSGAKSTPPYMRGKTETQQHKDKPGEGMYKSPDSSETQEEKDEGTSSSTMQKRVDREKASKDRWDDAAALEEEEDGDDGGR